MHKLILKIKLLKECIRIQQMVIDDFYNRLRAIEESEQVAQEEEMDGSRYGQKVQMDSELILLGKQLDFANEEMKMLQKMIANTTVSEQASLGAVVVTDRNIFFIAASEQFSVDGKTYIGLSTQSPLFKSMRGRKPGEQFSFKDTSYFITEVF